MNDANREMLSGQEKVLDDQQRRPLYTVSQAAAILQVAEVWIYERTRKGAIPHRKLGKHIRFSDSDLAAVLRMCARGPELEAGNDTEEQLNA